MIFPKETVQRLFWFDQYLHADNAICSKCTPDSITRLGWDINTRSIQEDEFDICVGSWINCFSQNWEVVASILEPSLVLLSCLYQLDDFALKSPRITIK